MKNWTKSLFCTIMFCFMCVLTYSQETLKKVGILPVKYSTKDDADVANQVTNLLYDAFVKGKRAIIINREFFKDLEDEKFLQSQIDFLDEDVVDKTKSQGATYLMIGKIASCRTDKKKNSNGDYSYSCQLNVGLRLIDVETGSTTYSFTLDNQNEGLSLKSLESIFKSSSSTKGKAIVNAVKELRTDLKVFLNDFFPFTADVVEIVDSKKGKAKSILVSVGSDYGLEEKDKFKVVKRSTKKINGEEVVFDKELGEVEIIEINATTASTARVKSGGDEIYNEFQNNSNLIIIPL